MVDEEVLDGTELQVARWRVEQLKLLGLDDDTADLIANSDADLRAIERMLEQGCSIPTMVKIVL